ncbi:MAG: hypothetical protein ACRECV_02440 [Xanthobacteraceae bacterium]
MANQIDPGSIGQKEKINILLEEYRSLRSEILTRTGYGFQVYTALAAVLTWFFGQPDLAHRGLPWVALVLVLILFVWFTAVNVREIWKCAYRTKEIEHEVNSRAGQHLLVWERLFGAARMGFLPGLVSHIRPLPRSILPKLDTSYWDEDKKNSN